MARFVLAIGVVIGMGVSFAACGLSPTSPSEGASAASGTRAEPSASADWSNGDGTVTALAAQKSAYCSATVEFASNNPSFDTIMIGTGWASIASPDPEFTVYTVTLNSTANSKFRSSQCSNAGGFYSSPMLRLPKR
jgi:hypothetical protein